MPPASDTVPIGRVRGANAEVPYVEVPLKPCYLWPHG